MRKRERRERERERREREREATNKNGKVEKLFSPFLHPLIIKSAYTFRFIDNSRRNGEL